MIGPVGGNGVLRQGSLTPGVGSAYAMNGGIDIEIDESSTLDLVWMGSTFKVFLAVVPSTDTKRIATGINV